MTIWTLVALAGALWWIAATASLAASFFGALLQPRIHRARPKAGDTPSVSLLLPVKLVNPGFERAQASAFFQDLPGYEILVAAAEEESPALAAMRRLAAASSVPVRILRSASIGAVSPKLDNLAAPLAAAVNDVIVTKDSNMSFAHDTLRAMLRGFTPDVGLVCAIPLAVRPETAAGHIEAILTNRDARLLLTASAYGKAYGVGKVMAFRRSDLEKAGGVAALAYTIAEDTALSRTLGAIGLATVFADTPVDQEIGARSLADVQARQSRWAVIRRTEEPLTFVLEPIVCPVPAAIAAMLAAPLVGLGPLAGFAATLVGWYLLEVLFTAAKGWEVRPFTPLAFLGRDVVLLTAWAKAWTTREVTWAGERREVRDVSCRPEKPAE